MKARTYQIEARDAVKSGSINLLTLPMRAGKSFLSKIIIDKYCTTKSLIIVGYRKIVLQFESYFPDNSTFILAGQPFDHTKKVHLATFQTYQNRDLEVSEYDLLIVDEYHSRQSNAVKELIKQAKANGATVILLTGTPLTNKNSIISEHIDKFIQPISVLQMTASGYLCPTRFFSVNDVISENKQMLKTNKNDYTEAAVTEVISKSRMLEAIVEQVVKNKLDTEHNTLVYVNFISTAEKLYSMLSSFNNVCVIHSKLPDKLQAELLDKYHSGPGICISVRSLSLGFDSPKSDRLVFGLLTLIHSLALQVMWRSSTLNPLDTNKEAHVYDMTGQLSKVNPYTDFSEYKIAKPSCMESAKKITDEDQRFYAMLACDATPPVAICNGELPSTYEDNNPYLIDFVCTTPDIKPCHEVMSVHDKKYWSEEDQNNKSIMYKHTLCKCGYGTKVVLKVRTSPEELVEVYNKASTANNVQAIYSKVENRVMLIIDDPKLQSYKFKFASNQADILAVCKKILNGNKYVLSCNIPLPKIPNAGVDKSLANVVDLVDWDEEDKNVGLIRKVVKQAFDNLNVQYGYKAGLTYWIMKGVSDKNIKRVVNELKWCSTNKSNYTKLRRWLEDARPPEPEQDSIPATSIRYPLPTPIPYDYNEDELPF